MYEMKTGTLFFQDKNGNNVLALNNVNELELTSNIIEETDSFGSVENIKRGGTTLSFTTDIIDKENLFKVLGVDSSKSQDQISFSVIKPVQRRKHKKKRINKKWLKKYGYKILVDRKNGRKIKLYADGTYEFKKGEDWWI